MGLGTTGHSVGGWVAIAPAIRPKGSSQTELAPQAADLKLACLTQGCGPRRVFRWGFGTYPTPDVRSHSTKTDIQKIQEITCLTNHLVPASGTNESGGNSKQTRAARKGANLAVRCRGRWGRPMPDGGAAEAAQGAAAVGAPALLRVPPSPPLPPRRRRAGTPGSWTLPRGAGKQQDSSLCRCSASGRAPPC